MTKMLSKFMELTAIGSSKKKVAELLFKSNQNSLNCGRVVSGTKLARIPDCAAFSTPLASAKLPASTDKVNGKEPLILK